jgi:hypothetical protein
MESQPTVCCMLHDDFFLRVLFSSGDEGDILLWNVCWFLVDCTVLYAPDITLLIRARRWTLLWDSSDQSNFSHHVSVGLIPPTQVLCSVEILYRILKSLVCAKHCA